MLLKELKEILNKLDDNLKVIISSSAGCVEEEEFEIEFNENEIKLKG